MPRKVNLPNGLSEKEQLFCFAYLKNGFIGKDAIIEAKIKTKYPNKVAYTYLQRPHIKTFIAKQKELVQVKMQKEHEATIDWKIRKLKTIVDHYLPDNNEYIPKCEEARVAIQAISELNKMKGHYAPEKRVNVEIDSELLERLIINNERAF